MHIYKLWEDIIYMKTTCYMSEVGMKVIQSKLSFQTLF